MTNTKLHMCFRSAPRSWMTLNC